MTFESKKEVPDTTQLKAPSSEEAGIAQELCPCCDLQCSLDAPQCDKGVRLAESRGISPALSSEREVAEDGRGGRRHRFATGEIGKTDDVDLELSHLFHQCAHLLVHRRGRRGGRARALDVLASQGAMTQRDLAEQLDIRPSSASELVVKMEAAGLVSRVPDPDDGRAVTVELTEAGKEEAAVVQRSRIKDRQNLFAALSEEEKRSLIEMFGKLVDSWRGPGDEGHRGGQGNRDCHGDGHGQGHREGNGEGRGQGHRDCHDGGRGQGRGQGRGRRPHGACGEGRGRHQRAR